jgi:hypothetical protein
MIAENIENIRKRIEVACFRCGRKPEEITLVGVSKAFSAERIREALAAGLTDIGESYVQELRDKQQQLRESGLRWHFIGHLQRNKVKYIADFVHLIHSVDDRDVANEINKRAERVGRKIDVLVEVHTTAEESKYGARPEAVVGLMKDLTSFRNIRLQGLMTMGPFSENPEDSRPSFRQLAEIKKNMEQEGMPMRHLSMGMTADFEIGIEEGATILRIGTAIFGSRPQTV